MAEHVLNDPDVACIADAVLASYLRIDERELEAGGLTSGGVPL
jgi:hypothetical protein